MTAHRHDDGRLSMRDRQTTARSTPVPPVPHHIASETQLRSSRNTAASRSADVLAYLDVLHALGELDRVERAALRLVYWHGRTQAQVAAELNLPLDTVGAAVARGMNRIADYLTATRAGPDRGSPKPLPARREDSGQKPAYVTRR